MKSKYLIFSVLGLAATASLTGCYDMDTKPLDQYLTEEQKNDAKENNPAMAQAGVTGITAVFSTFAQVFGEDYHYDFGFPAVMLGNDSRGIDMVSDNVGYNWFADFAAMSDCNVQSAASELTWQNAYKQIFAANATIKSIDKETDNAEMQFYLAQALAIRAYDYFLLAQTFQFTYMGNQDRPCVMLITEENEDDAALNGSKRSTVEEVYARIMEDLNTAISLLEESQISPSQVLTSKPKRFVSLATAYGLRARVNLVMNNWQEAADDADTAIKAFGGAPSSLAEAGHPGLTSLDESNWMWGIAIATTDRVVTSGIINWPSHMGSLNYGYASVGGWRRVNIALYNSIPDSDVRKGWFLDGEGLSEGLSEEQQDYITTAKAPAYTQVKFGPYQGELGTSENACDIPLMRIEEMYYIKAEGLAMAGGDGASVLNDFVTTYRDASYNFTGAGQAVQEECWMQRRVEFFGESLSTFDLMRLKKPFNRIGGGWDPDWCYNIDPSDNVLVLPIPESEINGNKAFQAAENNPSQPQPSTVRDVEYE